MGNRETIARPRASLPPLRSGLLGLLRRLFADFGRAQWRKYALAFICMGIGASCTALIAYLIGDVINQAYVYKNFVGIAVLCTVTTVLFTVKGFAVYGQTIILSRISNAIVAENQRRMFRKLLLESLAFFGERHSSEFLMRLNFGATAVSAVLNQLIMALGRDLMTLIGLATVMVIQDPWLSLIGFAVMPPAMLVIRKLTRRARNIMYNEFSSGIKFLETVIETVNGIRVVKAFGLEQPLLRVADANIAAFEKVCNKLARVSNRAGPLMEALGGIAISLVLFYGGFRVLVTGATPGEFVSFIAAFLLAYEPAKRLTRLHLDVATNMVGVEVLFQFLDAPATEPTEEHKPALVVTHGHIALRDVSFHYRPQEPVLRGISLVAEPRQVTALVGLSGGGKTTVMNLLMRFYEVTDGAILIDGVDISTVSRESLRRQIAYVGQDVHLFRGTIRENIAYGKPDPTQPEIEEAARAAFAHEFIVSFPDGYETQVGEHGAQLSGGQRQRIAIARALLRDAPIVLLDEATAALDSESEARVQAALASLCAHRTTIVIAHRLQTVMNADRIYVIENGEVVESGRHESLIRRNGRYKAFYALQAFQNDQAAEREAVA